MSEIRVLVSVPLGKYMNTIPFSNFWEIARRGWPIIDMPPGRTDEQRNVACAIAKSSGATHLCLLDVDHKHQPDVVDRLVRHVKDDLGKKVICGVQYRRCPPYNPCVYLEREGEFYWLHEIPENELISVQGVSPASILINVDVFEQIPAPWWKYTYEHADKNKYPGEDTWFSALLRDNNIDMYCDTSVTSPHLDNAATITDATYRAYCRVEEEMMGSEHEGIVYADVKTRIKV